MSLAKKCPNIINPETINSLISELSVYRSVGLEADELEMPVEKCLAWMAKQKKPGTGLPQFPVLPVFVLLAPWKRRLRKSIFHGEAHKDRISQSAGE